MKRRHFALLVALAMVLGSVIGVVDNSPGWDDTGITAGCVLTVSACFGMAAPRHPFVWAIAIGGWVPLLAAFGVWNAGALMALSVAFAGALLGGAIRRTFLPEPPRNTR